MPSSEIQHQEPWPRISIPVWCAAGVLGVITGRFYGISTVMTAGVIMCSAVWALRRYVPVNSPSRKIVTSGLILTLLYLGTFVSFRVFRTCSFSLVPQSDRTHYPVVFSTNPQAQDWALMIYSPLIRTLPGFCFYPTGKQMEAVRFNPFDRKPLELWW